MSTIKTLHINEFQHCYPMLQVQFYVCEYHSWARSSLILFTAVFLSSLVYLNVNVSQPCFSFLTSLLSCMNVFLLSSSTLSLPSYLIFLFFPLFSTLPGSICFCWTYSADRLLPSILFSCSRGYLIDCSCQSAALTFSFPASHIISYLWS